MNRAAVYIRRSTDEHQEASLRVQREEAIRFIESMGWSYSESHVYTDDAISRAEFKKRPGLLALLNAAEKHEFDIVVTRDETRLGGDMVRTTLLITDLLDSGTRLYYYISGEEVRLDDATAKFMVAAKNFAGELEREKIASRTAEHLLNKAKKGLVAGGKCFGYDNVEVLEGEKRVRVEYAINEGEASVVRDIYELYANGSGLIKIAKELNRREIPSPRSGKRGTGSWSPVSLYSLIRRTRYIGIIEYGRHHKNYKGGTKVRTRRADHEVARIDAPHLRIVSEELWNRVQSRMAGATRTTNKGGRPRRHLLSGIVRCYKCGGPMSVTNHRLGDKCVQVYVCGYNRTRGETVCSNTARRPLVNVNKAMVNWIQTRVLTEELTNELIARVRNRLDERAKATATRSPELEAEAQGLREEIERLVGALASAGQSPALIQALGERERRLAEVDAQIRAQLAAPEAIRFELKRMEVEARRRIEELRSLLERNPEDARRVVEALFAGGKLTAKPVTTKDGRRFLLEGAAAVGRLWVSESSDGSNLASPTRFELVLQP